EVHRLRKRDAAFADTTSLHGLRRRMVYLEDFQHVGKCKAAKRETVESRTDQDILTYAPDCCLPQRILRVPGADHHAREGGVGQQELVQETIRRLQGTSTHFRIHSGQDPLAHSFTFGWGYESIAPRVIQKGRRVTPRMQRSHQ